MKHNYNKSIIAVLFIFIVTSLSAQNIQFTFENAVNTNDGSNDFYEADIMIQTIDGLADFKLGSGQIYFNYNTAAFGENVFANAKFEVTSPNAEGYICGQYIDAAAAAIYTDFVINDNTTSRVSWWFGQAFSSSTFNNNVTAVPTKLCHIKLQYTDLSELPMVAFENDNAVLSQATDQFYTACGSASSGTFDSANCTSYPGTQFVGAIFDNTGAVLAVDDYATIDIVNISIYPNPTKSNLYIKSNNILEKVEVYNNLGQIVLKKESDFDVIDVSQLRAAVYYVKIQTESASKIIKFVKE